MIAKCCFLMMFVLLPLQQTYGQTKKWSLKYESCEMLKFDPGFYECKQKDGKACIVDSNGVVIEFVDIETNVRIGLFSRITPSGYDTRNFRDANGWYLLYTKVQGKGHFPDVWTCYLAYLNDRFRMKLDGSFSSDMIKVCDTIWTWTEENWYTYKHCAVVCYFGKTPKVIRTDIKYSSISEVHADGDGTQAHSFLAGFYHVRVGTQTRMLHALSHQEYESVVDPEVGDVSAHSVLSIEREHYRGFLFPTTIDVDVDRDRPAGLEIDRDGNVVGSEAVGKILEDEEYFSTGRNEVAVVQKGKLGLIRWDGVSLIPCIYDSVSYQHVGDEISSITFTAVGQIPVSYDYITKQKK